MNKKNTHKQKSIEEKWKSHPCNRDFTTLPQCHALMEMSKSHKKNRLSNITTKLFIKIQN